MPARHPSQSVVDQRFRIDRWPNAIAIALIAVLMLAAAYFFVRRLPSSWQQSLETCDRQEIIPRLHRLIDMQPDGIRQVTDSLKSERQDLALGAAQVLNVHLAKWERLPPHIGRTNAALVAEELAKNVSEFSPETKQQAARLAKQILRWPSDPLASNRAILVAHCDTVLQAVDAESSATRTALHVTTAGESQARQTILISSEQVSRGLPGGGIPIELPHSEPRDETVGDGPPITAGPAKSNDTASRTAPKSQAAAVEPPRLMPEASEALDHFRVEPKPMPSAGNHMSPAPNQPARLPVDSDLLSRLWGQPETLSSFELLRLAQNSDRETSKRAWDELQVREIPPKFLELGLHLTNPDPTIRRQWSQRLPSLPGIDARPWLLALSEDTDAEVRMNALVLMATMGDPRLLRRIEQIARDDREPQIQDQARRILEAGQ